MKIYEVIAEDITTAIKKTGVYRNKKEAIHEFEHNGYEIVRIKDVTDTYTLDVEFLKDKLAQAGYGLVENEIICNLVESWNAKISESAERQNTADDAE